MATVAVEYAQSDLPTVQKGLDSFGRTAANVQEYRDAYVSTYLHITYRTLHLVCVYDLNMYRSKYIFNRKSSD